MVTTQDPVLAVAPQIDHLPTDLLSDEPQMETDLHLRQMLLLISCLDMLWQDRNDFYATGNMTIYYSPEQVKTRDFRGPDFFVVLNTERRSRKSWVLWEEGGKYPNVIIEILSDSTAKVDRTTKKALYQDVFRTPEYFWFDPETLEFEAFALMNGLYEPIQPNQADRVWSQQLQLFIGIYNSQLRYFTAEGALVPTPIEAAQAAQQEAQVAQQKTDLLAAKLRELGVDPDTL